MKVKLFEKESFRIDSGDLSAVAENRIRDFLHESDRGASVDEFDFAQGHETSQLLRRSPEGRIRSGPDSPSALSSHLSHACFQKRNMQFRPP